MQIVKHEIKEIGFDDVDIRIAIGQPTNEQPLKMNCPDPIHFGRVGQTDDKGSMAVYRSNIHCFGCGYHIGRRYAALAFLMGKWDGLGDENGSKVRDIVKQVKKKLPEYMSTFKEQKEVELYVPPLEPFIAEGFQQFLYKFEQGRLIDELYTKRGLTEETVRKYKIGHTGTHFTIPVYDATGELYTMRYRADEEYTDPKADNSRKYEGMWRRNKPVLYPLPVVQGLTHIKELWIVEGELDAIASNQEGNVTLTITNGAGNISRIVDMVTEIGLHVKRWIVAVDQDGAGEQAAEKMIEALSNSGEVAIRARWNKAKDLCDYYASGGSKKRITFHAP